MPVPPSRAQAGSGRVPDLRLLQPVEDMERTVGQEFHMHSGGVGVRPVSPEEP